MTALADLDLRDDVPDQLEIDLRDTHPGVTPGAGNRERHVGLGLAAEIDRAVVDFMGDRLGELRILGIVGVAADHVHGKARHAQLLAPARIELGKLGDRRHLPEQAQRVETALLERTRGPRQLRGPTDLALDLADELADFGGGRLRLLVLDADERGLVLLIGEPDFRGAVEQQRERDHRDEERHVFAEQFPARLGGRRRLRQGCGGAVRGVVHSITSSASAARVGGTVRPSAAAVARLIASSNLVGACTGNAAGFAPLRMRST